MLSTFSLAARLYATTWFVLVVLYFLGMLAIGFTAGLGGLDIFMMAGFFTLLGSLPALVAILFLLPMLRSRAVPSREGKMSLALLLCTLVCGIPAAVVTHIFLNGKWLGPDAELLVFPGAAMVAVWVAVFVQQENIVRYANGVRHSMLIQPDQIGRPIETPQSSPKTAAQAG